MCVVPNNATRFGLDVVMNLYSINTVITEPKGQAAGADNITGSSHICSRPELDHLGSNSCTLLYLSVNLKHLLEVTAEDIYGPGGERLEEVTGVGVIHCGRGSECIRGGWVGGDRGGKQGLVIGNVIGWSDSEVMWEQRWWI